MFVGIGFIICTVLAVIIGVRIGRNRRANGKGAFFSGVTGIFGGAVAGFFLLVALALIDISVNGSDSKIEEIEPSVSEEQAPLESLYTVASDRTKAPYKRTVEVTLNEPVNKDQLADIAQQIKSQEDAEVERTFIGYRLESQDPDTAYWATTHYDPDLNVVILGVLENQIPESEQVASEPVSTDDAEQLASDKTNEKQAEIEAGSDLGFDAKTFARRFNVSMTDLGQPYRAKGNVDNSGVQGIFQEAFSEHLALTGTVKPQSGAVNGIIFMGTGDGTQESGARVMVVASGVVAATQPDMSAQNAFDVMLSLIQSYDGGEASSKVLNGVEYTYQRSDIFGNMLTVDSADS